MESIKSQAISKVILSGEHSVVYGYPAIALPIYDCCSFSEIKDNQESKSLIINAPQISEKYFIENNKTNCNPLELTVLNFLKKYNLEIPNIAINIFSNIPIASGMGSGASISTSIIKSLIEYYKIKVSLDEIYDLVFEIEKIYHGNPSGIDPRVIVYESPFYFIKNFKMDKININAKFSIVIINSGIKSSTKEVVEWVAQQKNLYPIKYNNIFKEISEISNNLRTALEVNDIDLISKLVNENHKLLIEMGVSTNYLNSLVDICLNSGALGAKLSGAGKGGIIIAIINTENFENFITNIKTKGINEYIISSYV